LSVWVDPIVVFSNPDVELETVEPEVEVVKLEGLADSITSYDNGYSFSPDQLKAIVDGILKARAGNLDCPPMKVCSR